MLSSVDFVVCRLTDLLRSLWFMKYCEPVVGMVLALASQHRGSRTLSILSLVVDKEVP